MVSMPIINAESLCNEYCFIGGSGVQLSMDTPDFGSDINSDSFPGRFVCGEIDDVERVSRVICDNIAYCCKEELCFQVYLVSIAVLKCCYSDWQAYLAYLQIPLPHPYTLSVCTVVDQPSLGPPIDTVYSDSLSCHNIILSSEEEVDIARAHIFERSQMVDLQNFQSFTAYKNVQNMSDAEIVTICTFMSNFINTWNGQPVYVEVSCSLNLEITLIY